MVSIAWVGGPSQRHVVGLGPRVCLVLGCELLVGCCVFVDFSVGELCWLRKWIVALKFRLSCCGESGSKVSERNEFSGLGGHASCFVWGVEFEIVDSRVLERKLVSRLEECDSCNVWDVGFEF